MFSINNVKTQTKEDFGDIEENEEERLNPEIECRFVDCSSFRSYYDKSNGTSFFHLNISSLSKHIDELNALLEQLDYFFDVIAITETRITVNTIPNNYDIPNFTYVMTNTEAEAGGTAIYIKNDISYTVRNDLQTTFYKSGLLESSFIEIMTPSNSNTIIGCIYKHPKLPKAEFSKQFCRSLLDKINHERKQAILLGDFNIDLLEENKKEVTEFLDILSSHSFYPTITLPTRITEHSETLIDNIFTNIDTNIQSGNLAVGISDHLPQYMFLKNHRNLSKKTNSAQYYTDWKSFNEEHFRQEIRNIDWNDALHFYKKDPDYSFEHFFYTLDNLLKKHLRKKQLSKKQIKSKPWISRSLKKSIELRNKLLFKLTKEKNTVFKHQLMREYKELRNLIVTQLREDKKNYYRDFFMKNLQNSKNTWSGIKDLIGSNKNKHKNNDITLTINGKNESNTAKIAEEFNNFFTDVAKNIRNQIPPTKKSFREYLKAPPRDSFFFDAITREEIEKTISELKDNKSVGPFSIPNKILKLISREVSDILAKIFNLSLTAGKYIKSLKTAKIIPIFKNKGSNLQVSNYRPIALLSNFDKIFEKLVHKRLTKFLNQKNIIYKYQYGFRKKHSTTHNLIALSEEIRKNLDNNYFSCGVFLDLQKAFDSVDHEILLQKLNHYGIRGICNKWIKSYLSDRKQFVTINNKNSETKCLLYGVPQGSVLGPLFFLIYVNDLQNCLIYSTSYIYADDTAVLCSEKSLKKLKKKMNIDLKLLSHWLNANKIALNVTKTETILFRKPNQSINYDLKIKLRGKKLFFVDETIYLGVVLDKHLSWQKHINKICTKLIAANGAISKLRHYVSRQTLITIYEALFSSHLNYALTVWAQNLPKRNRITQLQKTALRLMTFSRHDAHTKPLFTRLNILTIKDSIDVNNIILTYHTLTGTAPTSIQDTLNLQYLSTHTRGSTKGFLVRPEARTTTFGLYSIKYRLPLIWNKVQSSIETKLVNLNISKVKSITKALLSQSN